MNIDNIKEFIPLLEHMNFVEHHVGEKSIVYSNGLFGTVITFHIRYDELLCSLSEYNKFGICVTNLRFDVYNKFISKFEKELVNYFRKQKIIILLDEKYR